MTVINFVALLLVLVSAIAAQECQVHFSQQQRSTWASDTARYSMYDVLVQNNGDTPISDLTLSTTSSFESFWEIISVGGSKYVMPEWRALAGIEVDASHQFGYIIKGTQPAQFSLVGCTSGVSTAPTEAPIDAPTDAPTKSATDAPTQAATSAPTQAATKAPTAAPTQAATSAPTQAATKAPTAAPTDKPSKKPTSAPSTSAPTTTTKAPTNAPTSAPTTTKAPTTAPTSSSGGSSNGKPCSANSWWKPAPGTTWQWQLTGTIDTSFNVQMYDIDLFDATAATISTLHNAGRVVICYFSTQYEDWRPDAKSFTSAVIGSALDGWQGENYVDIRSPIVRNIMAARMDLAVSKGCDGIEPDNVDGYTANSGFPLKAADQLNFNQYIANTAHSKGLSVGLKNDVDQAAALQPYFDWALNEQCNQYSECSTLNSFITAGKAVFNCEYSGSASKICPTMVTSKFSTIIKGLDLDAKITAQCCTYATGGCAAVPYSCGTSASALLAEDEAQTYTPEVPVATEQHFDSSASAAHASVLLAVVAALGLLLA